MKKSADGYLTVEATITLTTFLFFMMFLMNMGQIYRAQNYVTHGMIQTGQMLSFASYEYGSDTTISELQDKFNNLMIFLGIPMDGQQIKNSWKSGDCAQAVRLAFGYCAGGDSDSTEQYLKRYGLSQGMADINFSGTHKDEENLYVQASYTVQLPFAFFGYKSITMHQQIVCGLWE